MRRVYSGARRASRCFLNSLPVLSLSLDVSCEWTSQCAHCEPGLHVAYPHKDGGHDVSASTRHCDSVNGPVRWTRRATNTAPRRLRHCRCCCFCGRCTRRAVIVPVCVTSSVRDCVSFPRIPVSRPDSECLGTVYLDARCRLPATVSSGGRLSHATTNHDAGFTAAVSLADAPPRSPAMSRSASHGRQGGEPTPSERIRSRPNVVRRRLRRRRRRYQHQRERVVVVVSSASS